MNILYLYTCRIPISILLKSWYIFVVAFLGSGSPKRLLSKNYGTPDPKTWAGGGDFKIKKKNMIKDSLFQIGFSDLEQ